MHSPITMGSKTSAPGIVGLNQRKLTSWIDAFVKHTDNLDSPTLFRKWSAIATLAAAVEEKVWITTSSRMHPNLYVIVVGHPGVGKTRTIRAAREYYMDIPEFHLAPTSMTAASCVDALTEAKRILIRPLEPTYEYNSMFICADELGAFMHKYDDEMIAVLSSFYDPDPYGQNRRGKDIKIKINRPQLNLLCGSTPSNLMNLMPEGAWDQGYTSRIILIFSDERIIGDDFASTARYKNTSLSYDLKLIHDLSGEFKVTEDYRTAVNNWRKLGEPPAPSHPKLLHYNSRRKAHLYKLSMVSAIDQGNALVLTKGDFNRALGWLIEAEEMMPEIFKAGAQSADSKAMDEIYHFCQVAGVSGKGVSETAIVNFARDKIPAQSVMRVLEIMERAGMLKAVGIDKKTGLRTWVALKSATPVESLLE